MAIQGRQGLRTGRHLPTTDGLLFHRLVVTRILPSPLSIPAIAVLFGSRARNHSGRIQLAQQLPNVTHLLRVGAGRIPLLKLQRGVSVLLRPPESAEGREAEELTLR